MSDLTTYTRNHSMTQNHNHADSLQDRLAQEQEVLQMYNELASWGRSCPYGKNPKKGLQGGQLRSRKRTTGHIGVR